MTGRRVWILGLVFLIGLGAAVPAQAEDRVVVNFQGPLELEVFLQELTSTLDLPFLWNPKSRGLQNKQVIGSLRFEGTPPEILEAVRAMLVLYELVIIPVGQGENERLLIVDVRQTASTLKLKPVYVEVTDDNVDELAKKDGLFVTTTIPTENLTSMRDARNALTRIVTGQNIGSVTEIPDARSFVVTDFAPNVAAIYRLLRRMDAPASRESGREITFRAIKLKHAPAVQTTATLVQHFGTADPVIGRQRAQRGPTQQGSSTVPAAPQLRIHADARLNQVLVTGTSKDVDAVAAVIATLDLPLPRTEAAIQYVRLENKQAVRVAATLMGIIAGSPSLWSEGPTGTVRPAVQADADGNAILLHASEPVLSTLRRLISEIDSPPAEEGRPSQGD